MISTWIFGYASLWTALVVAGTLLTLRAASGLERQQALLCWASWLRILPGAVFLVDFWSMVPGVFKSNKNVQLHEATTFVGVGLGLLLLPIAAGLARYFLRRTVETPPIGPLRVLHLLTWLVSCFAWLIIAASI